MPPPPPPEKELRAKYETRKEKTDTQVLLCCLKQNNVFNKYFLEVQYYTNNEIEITGLQI